LIPEVLLPEVIRVTTTVLDTVRAGRAFTIGIDHIEGKPMLHPSGDVVFVLLQDTSLVGLGIPALWKELGFCHLIFPLGYFR
jgi:hypothetical protein